MRTSNANGLLDSSAAGQVAIDASGSTAGLKEVAMVTSRGAIEVRGDQLLAVGRDGLPQTAAEPVGKPENVELVGFCGVSGMPHRLDSRRYGAFRRHGGATRVPQPHTRPNKADGPRSAYAVEATGSRSLSIRRISDQNNAEAE